MASAGPAEAHRASSSAGSSSVVETAPNGAASPNEPDASHETIWMRELRRVRVTCTLGVHRALGTNGQRRLDLHYPLRFKLLAMVTVMTSCWWMLNFFIAVLPAAIVRDDGPCRIADNQLKQDALVLFACFLCFALVRIVIFLPGVAARVGEILLGQEGPGRLYSLKMIMHGPLYIFGIGSLLFTVQLVMSPNCEVPRRDPELHDTFRTYAIYSCLVFVSCLSFEVVHSAFISHAARRQALDKRRAPPGIVESLLTLTYDPDVFGDEDEKAYPGECPICLQEWEVADMIKITPCRHAFHVDCIGHWLATERTCAFCRRDITLSCLPRSTIGALSASRSSASRSSAQQISAPQTSETTSAGGLETEHAQAIPGVVDSPSHAGSLMTSQAEESLVTTTNNRQDVALDVVEVAPETIDEIMGLGNLSVMMLFQHDWDAAVPTERAGAVRLETVMDDLDPAAHALDRELDMLEHALQELERNQPATCSA